MATPGPSASGSGAKRPRLMNLEEAQRELERLFDEESDDGLLSDDSLENEGEEDEDSQQQVLDPENRANFDVCSTLLLT